MTQAEFNDNMRQALGIGCMLVQTQSVCALSDEDQSRLREAVETFDDFNEDNDPYGEHDFGKIVQDGVNYFWKIDDYGPEYIEYAPRRYILTLMRADEY